MTNSDSGKRCIHAIVTGRVQGVFYRAHTQKLAEELGITGWVRNCADKTVELVACGEKADIEVLIEWIHKGPPLAKVTEVWIEEWPSGDFEIFLVEKDRL
jgi:acylphosphatase